MASSRSRRAKPDPHPGGDPPAEAVATEGAGEDATAPGLRVELYLLRHADAGDPMAWQGDDADRPLSNKGRRQARRVGRWLADLGRRPDAIVTSPKARALQTATIVAASFGLVPSIDDRLAGPIGHETLQALIAEHIGDGRRVLLVGHDPDFSSMTASLSGAPVSLRKGAMARIDLADGAAAGSGTLRWLIPADAVPERS